MIILKNDLTAILSEKVSSKNGNYPEFQPGPDKKQYEVGEQVQTEAKWKSTAIFGGLFILSDIK